MRIGKVEKTVKIPEVNSRIKYPWAEMEVGDSVFIRAEQGEDLIDLNRRISTAARYYGNVTDKKFKTHLMREDSGVRVWRVA